MPKHPETTWILVCDGARGRIFANYGPGTGLTVVTAAEHPESHGHTRDLGADRPGRSFDSSGSGGRHAMEPPVDWHQFEKTKFAKEMAAVIDKAAVAAQFDWLVVVAPPHVLGDLRKTLHSRSKAFLKGELDKDLTHLDGDALAAHLTDWVSA